MSMTDPISDMLTRIRNACKAKHRRVDIPASKLKIQVARILQEEKFISNFKHIEDQRQGVIRVYLKYGPKEQNVICGLKRVSKPGRRVYAGRKEIPRVLGGLGIAVLSTPRGLMTDKECRRQGVGGEVLCYVW